MPDGCTFSGTCPSTEATALFTEVNGYGQTTPAADGSTKTEEDTKREAALKALQDAIKNVTVPGTASSLTDKCKEYCKQIEKAEAKRCAMIREKVALVLKQAGCPSKVTPYSSSRKSTTSTTSKTSTTASTASKSAKTRGGCTTGTCGR